MWYQDIVIKERGEFVADVGFTDARRAIDEYRPTRVNSRSKLIEQVMLHR